jgi:cytochrome c biogenesis protein CcmG/thiol:disulfide interchange protein DsbE
MRPTLAVGAIALVAVFSGCTGDDDGEATPATQPGDRVSVDDGTSGDDLSDVVLAGLEGGELAFADYAGRPIVVNFFASTCAPCVQEMPDIESVKRDVGEEVAFIGVATNDRVDDAIERAEETGVTWDLANDPRGDFITQVGGVILPTTVLVDAESRIAEVHGGQIDAGELRDLLEEHFGIEAS